MASFLYDPEGRLLGVVVSSSLWGVLPYKKQKTPKPQNGGGLMVENVRPTNVPPPTPIEGPKLR